MCTPLSIDQLFIFGIFEHKWGTRKHIDDLKKYPWCIPVQKEIKPIIWGAAITLEPWNRQQCWFIFEDPNVRVARLLESLATITKEVWFLRISKTIPYWNIPHCRVLNMVMIYPLSSSLRGCCAWPPVFSDLPMTKPNCDIIGTGTTVITGDKEPQYITRDPLSGPSTSQSCLFCAV